MGTLDRITEHRYPHVGHPFQSIPTHLCDNFNRKKISAPNRTLAPLGELGSESRYSIPYYLI